MEVLAIIGLVIGLVVLLVVIWLLQNTLRPLLAILADVQGAHAAPLLERGVPGTEQLGQTRRLADSVPPLALAYLAKLGANPAPPPTPTFPQPQVTHSGPPPGAADSSWAPPAWHQYRTGR